MKDAKNKPTWMMPDPVRPLPGQLALPGVMPKRRRRRKAAGQADLFETAARESGAKGNNAHLTERRKR